MAINAPVRSKINWLAGIMVILGALCDPDYVNLLPALYAPKIIQVSGLLLMIFRTFFTAPKEDEQIHHVDGKVSSDIPDRATDK